jgi:hypothetical protein
MALVNERIKALMKRMSAEKLQILQICLEALYHADDKKIAQQLERFDNLTAEEEEELDGGMTIPQVISSIQIRNTSISTELYLNGKYCLDENIEW